MRVFEALNPGFDSQRGSNMKPGDYMKLTVPYSKEIQLKIWEEYLKKKTKFDYTTLYIHFPFCKQKCNYCMHDSGIMKNSGVIEGGIKYLEEQFKFAQQVFKNEPISAIYFGGGSASLLESYHLDKVLNLVDKYWNLQKTDQNMMAYEMHPSQVTDEKIRVLRDSFINRISMGIQSFDPEVIKAVGRIYVPKQEIIKIYHKLAENFDKVNIDFMYGLTGQTDNSFYSDIKAMVDEGAQRITMYGYNNVTGNRPIKDDQEYEITALVVMNHIKNIFKNQGYLFGGSTDDKYNEWNCLIKNNRDYSFQYFYNTLTTDFNNCVAFSYHPYQGRPLSFYTPIDLITAKSGNTMTISSYMDKYNFSLYDVVYNRRVKALKANKRPKSNVFNF